MSPGFSDYFRFSCAFGLDLPVSLRFVRLKMSDSNKRKVGDADSPLQSKTVSKMRLIEKEEIVKFQNELATYDNTE